MPARFKTQMVRLQRSLVTYYLLSHIKDGSNSPLIPTSSVIKRFLTLRVKLCKTATPDEVNLSGHLWERSYKYFQVLYLHYPSFTFYSTNTCLEFSDLTTTPSNMTPTHGYSIVGPWM